MIVLDTNVLSALMRRTPDLVVVKWLDTQPRSSVSSGRRTLKLDNLMLARYTRKARGAHEARYSMRMLYAVAITFSLLLLTVPASAHHSFAAEFDANNCREFTGIFTKLDWQSPHAYFYVDVKDASGKVEPWSFQTYALITLRRAGNDRQVFLDNIGKEVWVRGCIAKNGRQNYAAAGTLKFSDGVLRQVGQLQD